MLRDKITILVNTCDQYSDLWLMFYKALEEYWPDRQVEVVFNTENISSFGFDTQCCSIHNSESLEWGQRLRDVLASIDTTYVLMVCDDFILEDYINVGAIEDIIDYMDGNEKISSFYLDKIDLESIGGCKYDGFSLISPEAEYRLNTAPAIWKKSDLLLFTGGVDTPWAWEVFGTYRTQKFDKDFYQRDAASIYTFNGKKGGAIYRGKWVAEVVVPKVEKYNLNIDFNLRGFSSDLVDERRTMKWKISFLHIGFKMVGLDFVKFVKYYLKSKIKKI